MKFGKMIKIIGLVIVATFACVLTVGLLVGCDDSKEKSKQTEDTMVNKIKVNHHIKNGDEEVYKLKNGQWTTILPEQSEEVMQKKVDSLKELKSNLKDGTNMIYVQLPYKVESNDQLMDDVKDGTNANADFIVNKINGSINTVDMRQVFKDNKVAWSDVFFNTDHHWRPEAGLYAAEYLMNYMNDKFEIGYNTKLFGENAFDVTNYPGYFLGSEGKLTGEEVMGADDFSIYEPKYNTNFVAVGETQEGKKFVKNGPFGEALLDKASLVKDYSKNVYTTYTGGDFKYENVKNLSNDHNGKKLLLVKDSYSCVMMPFLALQFEEITTLDLRHYTEKSLQEYLDSNEFDVVMIAYNPSAFEEKQFTFK